MNAINRVLLMLLFGGVSAAATGQSYYLAPPSPTSADSIQLIADATTCITKFKPLGVNPYSVSMKNSHITITFNRAANYGGTEGVGVPPPDQQFRRRFIEVGKLPAGQYTWSVEDENPFTSCQESNKNGIVPKN